MRLIVFHLIAAVHFSVSCYYDWFHVNVPSNVNNMGADFGKTNKLKYLTYWNAMLQAVVYTICFLNDILGNNDDENGGRNDRTFLRRLQDTLITCLALPISLFVGLTFWGLYVVDRELVLPKALDPYFPAWLNHCMHTNIMIFILIEVTLFCHRYPSGKHKGLAINIGFMLVYLIWVHIIYNYTGTWVYPVLKVLTLPYRICFFAVLLGLSTSLYYAGVKYHHYVWKREVEVKENASSSQTRLLKNK